MRSPSNPLDPQHGFCNLLLQGMWVVRQARNNLTALGDTTKTNGFVTWATLYQKSKARDEAMLISRMRSRSLAIYLFSVLGDPAPP